LRALSLTLPLLLLLVWGCDGCDKKPAEQELATLIQVQGQVSVLRTAQSRPGRVDERLYAGETITTGAGSTARVRYINGIEVEVAENSRFRVNGVPGALTLELEEGRIVSTSPQAANGGLTVTGPFGRAQLVTAAEMVFDLRDEAPRLTLQYGEISVVGPDGKTVPMQVGEELSLSLSKPPQEAPPAVVRAEEIVFTLKPQGGKARVRGAQESAFTELGPDQPRELGAGSAFEIPAQSSARLSSGDLAVNLSGDTTGTLTSASRQGDQKSYALQLGRGKARLQFSPGQHSLRLTDAKGPFELKVSEQSSVSVNDPQRGATVTVHTGQLELVADGTTTVLKAGDRVDRSASAQAAQVAAPALVLPPNVKARVFTDALREAGIQVPSSSGPLRVEVAEEPGFKEPVLAGRAGAEPVRVEPPARGELHWRFLAEDGSVREQGSARFQPDRGRSSLAGDSPRADVLETGLKASITFQSAVPSLRFSFSPREGARSYQLRIYRASDMKTPLLQRVTDKSQYTLEPGALREGNYLWYVAALGSGGVELAGGRMNKLELVYDNARRGLALSRPRPGERPGRDGIPVEGVVPLGSRLFLNGKPVSLDAKGRFSLREPPTEQLVFRLVSEQGEAYWVRTLRSERR
jgi:ferric-dicitrate binding protein FerR (iron transport regulator)